MALNTYRTGTVSIEANATVIVGAGGPIWTGNARPGDRCVVLGHEITLLGVIDDNHLAIDPWPFEAVPAGTAYKIHQLRSEGTSDFAQDVSWLVAVLNKKGFVIPVGPDETEPDPSYGDEGQGARQYGTGKEWLKLGGIWVYQGTTGSFNFTGTPWSAGTIYAQRAIAPRAGKLWMSLQANNVGHTPESSPTWWSLFMSGGDAYDVVMFDTDRPDSGELVLKLVFTKAVTFYAGLSDSRAAADVAATGSVAFSYRKNGVQFATLTFAASASGVFASASDTAFALGDVLTIIAPAMRDPTLSGVGATLSGYRA